MNPHCVNHNRHLKPARLPIPREQVLVYPKIFEMSIKNIPKKIVPPFGLWNWNCKTIAFVLYGTCA